MNGKEKRKERRLLLVAMNGNVDTGHIISNKLLMDWWRK